MVHTHYTVEEDIDGDAGFLEWPGIRQIAPEAGVIVGRFDANHDGCAAGALTVTLGTAISNSQLDADLPKHVNRLHFRRLP